MLSRQEQATQNLDEARVMRAEGRSYREIRRQLGLTQGQLAHIRRILSRTKAARTRLYASHPSATDRDLPIGRSVLPSGLRHLLTAYGFRTLGDLADRLADHDLPDLESIAGIGPHRVRQVKAMLDHHGLLPGAADLQSSVECVFPELRSAP